MSISRIYRILRLITLLQSGRGYSADELAEELEVSRRTVFRDLNVLEMAHIPYYHEAPGGYRISRHFFLPPVNLTLAESLAVLMLAGRLRGTGRLPLAEQAARAAMKIESGLPRGLRDHVGSILDRVHMSIGPTSGHEGLDETFKQLCTAAATRKVCRIEYVSFHEQQQIATEVHPLRLVFVSRAWYVRAFSVMHGEVRTFKLTRIRLLDVAEQTFEPPPGADGDEPFGAAWSMIPEGRLHDVHLRFEEMVAGNVAEVQWHPSQRVTRHDDGTIDFHVTVDGLREISWWILGYGDQVEVVDPPELRERIAEVAARAVEKNSRRAGRS